MNVILAESIAQHLAAQAGSSSGATQGSHVYQCCCGQPVYFSNSRCLSCQSELGYDPGSSAVINIVPDVQPNTWRAAGEGAHEEALYHRCANYGEAAGCNWLVPQSDGHTFCQACRLNRTIPSLDLADNARHWSKLEHAKRRLVAQLIKLGLPVEPKMADGSGPGLAFEFLASSPDQPRILTGHNNGFITLNIEEADDAVREHIRTQLGEPYRTLLGHFRHEVGHYYWDRLVAGSEWLEPYRALFGDERADYAEALRNHYANGGSPWWQGQFVSSYASSHPWEDWAETWAHYMHFRDSLDTALGYGIGLNPLAHNGQEFGIEDLYDPTHPDAGNFLRFIKAWMDLVTVLNELSRSLGQVDFYPFVLTAPVLKKLHFIHLLIASVESQQATPEAVSGRA